MKKTLQTTTKVLSHFRLFTTVLLVTLNFSAFAAPKMEVSGQVKDKNSKENLEYCSVRIFNLKDSLIAGVATDNNGYFNVLLEEGTYKLNIDYSGYKTFNQDLTVHGGNNFLGIFALEANDTELKEVTVKGKTKESTLEKELVLVTSDMRIGASNTNDVLEKVQGLSYDRYNNTISVDGNKNIVFLVNGMEKDPQYIRNLSPDRLQKIEIIRDPGGRYALEGYSAIINVILKNDYHGSELFFDNMALFDPDAKSRSNIFVVDNFTTTYNYTYNKINFYSKIQSNLSNVDIPFQDIKTYSNGQTIEQMPAGDNPENLKIFNLNSDFTAGLDYYLDPRQTISYEANFSMMPFGAGETLQKMNIREFNPDSVYTSETNQTKNPQTFYNTLFYKGKLNNNNSVNADFTYTRYEENENVKYFQNNILQSDQTSNNNKNYTDFNIELEHQINDKMNLDFGYGNSFRKTVNGFAAENQNSIPDFKYTELRNKIYGYYSIKFNEKFGLKLGIASEQSKPEIDGKSRDFYLFEPYADFKYTLSQNFNFKLQYRSEGIYPDISQANPFTTVIDQQTESTGNPYLEPTVIHKISFRAELMQGLFAVEPYYHFSNNYITQTGNLLDNGIFEYTFSNAGQYVHEGIKGNLTIPFSKSVILQSSLDFFKSSIAFEGKTNRVNDWSSETQLIYLNKKYKTVSGLLYQKNVVKNISAQGWNNNNNDFWMIFVQQPFFKGNMTVLLGYMLPLNFGCNYNQSTFIQTEQYSEMQKANISLLKNILLFKLSYRFQKGKEIKKNEKDIIHEDEKKSKGGLF
jgi:hypothetical protein